MSYFIDERDEPKVSNIIIAVGILVVVVIGALMLGIPVYRVWAAGKAGQASLAHAHFEREVQVVNAKANLEAQKFNADAEVVRAEGVAKANEVIKNSITELYVKYLWVHTLDQTSNQIIYVPLGADGLPITEAGRAVK